MKENRKIIIITSLICLIPMILGMVYYNQLPEQMPIHWNTAGEVDGYAPKAMALFGMPGLLLGLQLLMFAVILNDPKKQNQSKIMRDLGFWCIPVLGLIVTPVMIFTALGHDVPVTTIILALCGVMFIIVGNYLPKTKQNYTIGIKLPWTLHDTENWNKTHRLAGFLWVVGGVIFLAAAFVPQGYVLVVGTIVVMVLIPTGYSFWLYQKKHKA